MKILYFFFQAEDGIRDGHVTGVQTCALPILEPYSTTVRSIAFVSGGEELISEDPLTVGDVTYQQPTSEELTYNVVLNNQPVRVTIVLLIQGGPPQADAPNPVLLAAPTASGGVTADSDLDASTAPSDIKVNTNDIPSDASSL